MKRLLPIIYPVAFLTSLFFYAFNLYAYNVDKCLMEAIKYADHSVTVGQLHEQCQEETGKISRSKPLKTNSFVETGPNGPEEIILKTSQAKKPAYFPHKRHQGKYSCGICHHGKNSYGEFAKYTQKTKIYKCTACHNQDMPNDLLNGFQLVGHKLCRECHRKNQNITSAKCSTCHRKNL